MTKVSVIVPVYGVEKYIERCARSLFEQTLDDIEYIFVNDCTKDKSIEVLEHVIEYYPKRKSQIKILHHDVNKGLPQARKTGIDIASGEYIAHCDSDDWVDSDMYRAMYEKAQAEKTDVIVCDFYRTDGKKAKLQKGCHSTDLGIFETNCLFQKDHWALWNKLFARVCYNDITLPCEALGEDMMTCIQLLKACKKMGYINRPFYNYFYNTNSITKKRTIKNCIYNYYSLKSNTDFVIDYINKYYNREFIDIDLACKYLRMINQFTLLYIKHLPEYNQLWKNELPIMPLRFYTNNKIGCYNKIVYLLSYLGFYPRMHNRITE